MAQKNSRDSSEGQVAKPLSLLSHQTHDLIARALTQISNDEAEKRNAQQWIGQVLADVRRLDLLLHLANRSLEGDTAAAIRLCELLEGVLEFQTESYGRDRPAGEVESQACFDSGGHDLASLAGRRAIDSAALLTLMAGIAWSAKDHEQLQRCLWSLTAAIGPLREVERLFDAAHSVLSGTIPPPLLTPLSLGGRPGIPGKGDLPNILIPDPDRGVGGLFGKNSFKKKPLYVEGAGYIIPILSTHRDVVSCTLRFLRTLPALQQAAPKYRIDSISDPAACGGTVITLRGVNFGSDGLVIFPAAGDDPNGRALVQANSWSDTEIVVQVSAVAGPGPIGLRVRDHDIKVCNQTFILYRLGEGLSNFSGGTPSVFSLAVNGQSSPPVVVTPASIATITWYASQAPDTTLNVRVFGPAGTLSTFGPFSGVVGTVTFDVPDVTEPTDLTVEVTAAGHCGSTSKHLALKATVPAQVIIEGLEITQGIQNFRRTGVPNNDLPTIAGKDTIVRAYVYADRKGFMNDKVKNMTASLAVDGVAYAPINGQKPNGGTPKPFLDLGSKAALLRYEADHTFNFRIPAPRCQGTRTLKLLVFGKDELGGRYHAYTTSWTWLENEALPVRWILVRDGRGGGSGLAPTDDEARFTVLRALDLLPTPPTNIAPAWLATWNTTTDFTARDGPDELLDNLDNEHDCNAWESAWSTFGLADCPSPDNAIWIGLTSTTNPINRGKAGRPGNTAVAMIHSLSSSGDVARTTPAHELGHCAGRMHVNRGCGASTPGGPYFAHPDNGNLLNVPFDPFYNNIIGSFSGSVQCLMSYGCAVWVSEYEWTDLLNVI